MLSSANVTQIPTTNPSVYAFRITSGVTSEDFAAIADVTNLAMDRHDTISLLFILHDFGLSDAVAGLNLKTLGAQFRSLAHVDRYAVVGAPVLAAVMIDTFDKVSSIAASAFEPSETDDAWAFVGARPREADGDLTH